MARIIEICGSPGVGKSTIFDQLAKINKGSCSWATATNDNPWGEEAWSEFLSKVCSEFQTGRKFIGRTTRKESHLNFLRRIYRTIKLGRNFIDLVVLKEAGDRFVAQHPRYLDACWKNIYYRQSKSSNGLDLRFEKAEFIYRIIKKIQILREKDTKKNIIIDEGLVNMIDRALYKSTGPEEEREEIIEILEVMPVPDAIVYLETDLKENAHRLIARHDLRDMHRGLNLEELIQFTSRCRERIITAINYLEGKGIPVLVLDSTKPVEVTAQKIIHFASNLEKESLPSSVERAIVV